MNEACDDNGVAVKPCAGVSTGMTGMDGNINEVARWQSTQWVQVSAGLPSVVAGALWHGIDAASASAGSSVAAVEGEVASALDAAAPAGAPEMGIIAAMAPDNGSHSSMNTSTSLRKKFMDM